MTAVELSPAPERAFPATYEELEALIDERCQKILRERDESLRVVWFGYDPAKEPSA